MSNDRIELNPDNFSLTDKVIGFSIIIFGALISSFLWLSALGIIK